MAVPPGYSALGDSERPRPDDHRLVGPVGADRVIGASLLLRPQPGSPPRPGLDEWPGPQRFLSPADYARTYGATEADLDAVTAFAADHGLTVTERHGCGAAEQVEGQPMIMPSSARRGPGRSLKF